MATQLLEIGTEHFWLQKQHLELECSVLSLETEVKLRKHQKKVFYAEEV